MNEHLATDFGAYLYLTSLHALVALGQIASKKDGISLNMSARNQML